jgi:hypothetical protein
MHFIAAINSCLFMTRELLKYKGLVIRNGPSDGIGVERIRLSKAYALLHCQPMHRYYLCSQVEERRINRRVMRALTRSSQLHKNRLPMRCIAHKGVRKTFEKRTFSSCMKIEFTQAY